MDDADSSASTSASPPSSAAPSEFWCILDPEVSLLLIQWLHPADLAALASADFSTSDQLSIAVLWVVCSITLAWLRFFRGLNPSLV